MQLCVSIRTNETAFEWSKVNKLSMNSSANLNRSTLQLAACTHNMAKVAHIAFVFYILQHINAYVTYISASAKYL